MQRPPKPAFKSTQIFNHPLRRLISPQVLLPEAKNLQQNLMKSMRQSSTSNCANHAIVDNVEYLELSKKQEENRSSTGVKSFKIRNYTHQNRRIKENTIPIKQNNISDYKGKKNTVQKKTIKPTENANQATFFSLNSYPSECELQHISHKIYFHCNEKAGKKNGIFNTWVVILNYCLISYAFSEDSIWKKFKESFQRFLSLHEGICFFIKVKDQNQALSLEKQFQKRKFLQYDCIIYNKQKYIERINAYDIQQLNKQFKLENFIVLSDVHDPTYELPFTTKKIQNQKLIDFSNKLVYIGCNKIGSLLEFYEKSRILALDNQVLINSQNFTNLTQKIMMMQEIYHKVGVFKSLKNIKYMRAQSRNADDGITSRKSITKQEKAQDFKRKMLKQIRKIEEEKEHHRKNSPYKINKNNKSVYQVMDEIVKANIHIFHQINKFHEESSHFTAQFTI